MNADIFGIVFRFALALGCPCSRTLSDLRSFARVSREARAAIRKLDTPEVRLRV
jgi:hypothetical protein